MQFKQPEAEAKKAVFAYLEMKRYHYWPSNNTGIYDSTRKVYRKPHPGFKKGVPDANLLHNGKYYAIELKSTEGKQSKEQKEFEKKTIKEGGVYLLIRSIDDLISAGL